LEEGFGLSKYSEVSSRVLLQLLLYKYAKQNMHARTWQDNLKEDADIEI
jgi:hypothetical protein